MTTTAHRIQPTAHQRTKAALANRTSREAFIEQFMGASSPAVRMIGFALLTEHDDAEATLEARRGRSAYDSRSEVAIYDGQGRYVGMVDLRKRP